MIRKGMPSRMRRTCGYMCIALAALIVGYSAWAAGPAPVARSKAATMTSASNSTSSALMDISDSVSLSGDGLAVETAGGLTRIVGSQLRLNLGPETHFSSRSDHVATASDGSQTLEGHVRITARIARIIRADDRVISTDLRPLIANGQKVVVSPRRGGGFNMTIENGDVWL